MMKRKNSKIVAIVISILCVLCTIPFYFDRLLASSLDLFAPHTRQFDTLKPQLLHEFPNGVYEFSWLDDASHLVLNIAPDTIADFNLNTNEVVFQEEAVANDQVSPPEMIQRLGIATKTKSWALCPEKNLVIAADDAEDGKYWLKFWKNEELVSTFYFSSEQWTGDFLAPSMSVEFSPSCSKATLVLSGWVAYEGDGNEELWMLDIASQTFEQLVIGRGPIFGWQDYPVQYITPSWSPGEDRFVFGGWTFPLEVYNLSSAKRKILTGPRYNLHSAQWSPSGNWIAAIQSGDDVDKLYLFSPDGSLHSMTDGCSRISEFQWAPKEDRIAFICYDTSSDYLWLWDLE